MREVMHAVTRFMSRAGYDADFGRRRVHELEGAGLLGRARRWARARVPGASPSTTFLRLSFESMGAALLSSGELMQEDLDWLLATLDDPDTVFLTPMIAAWGAQAAVSGAQGGAGLDHPYRLPSSCVAGAT